MTKLKMFIDIGVKKFLKVIEGHKFGLEPKQQLD